MIDSEVIQVSKECGFNVSKVDALKLEASGREYYRISKDSGETFVLCYLDPNLGNHSKFQHVSKFLFDQNVRCPEIIFYDDSLGITIQEACMRAWAIYHNKIATGFHLNDRG